jgi:hypothetical protein
VHVRQQFVIFDQNSKAPLDYEIDFTKSDMLKIQVIGNGICQIKVYGKIAKGIDYSEVGILRDCDYNFIDTITEKGIYTVSATGYQTIKISVVNASNILCYANEVVEA